jgi:hypothetical protein
LDAEVRGKTSISKKKKIRILEENEGNQKLMFGTEPSILLLEIPSDAHLRTSKKIKLLQQHHQTSSTISNSKFLFHQTQSNIVKRTRINCLNITIQTYAQLKF